jgi:hypothetical protein
MAKEHAKEQNTSIANALKAILKWECDSGIFPLHQHWINGPQTGSINELWIPDNPMNIENTTWTAIVKQQAIFGPNQQWWGRLLPGISLPLQVAW